MDSNIFAESSSFTSEDGDKSGGDRPATPQSSYITFFIETESLESAYCFGLDMLEHLVAQSSQSVAYLYDLFVKNAASTKGLKGFEYITGEISLDFLHDIFPYDAQQVLLSGGEEFRSRIYRYLRELPNRGSGISIREYN